MFESSRAGNAAVFGDVANQNDWQVLIFGYANEVCGHLANLRGHARSAIDFGVGNGLHRVDNQQVGLGGLYLSEHSAQVGFAGKKQVLTECASSLGSKANLTYRLFAADVENSTARLRGLCSYLEQQG